LNITLNSYLDVFRLVYFTLLKTIQ